MGLLDFFKKTFSGEKQEHSRNPFIGLIEDARITINKEEGHYWGLVPGKYKSYQELLAFPDEQKLAFILQAMQTLHTMYSEHSYRSDDVVYQQLRIWQSFMRQLLKTKLALDDNGIHQLLGHLLTYRHENLYEWPVNLVVNQLEKHYKQCQMQEDAKSDLQALKELVKHHIRYNDKEQLKLMEKIDGLLFTAGDSGAVKPTYFLSNDEFAIFANKEIEQLPEKDQPYWWQLLQWSQKATGSTPGKKFLTETGKLIDELGVSSFMNIMAGWIKKLSSLKENTIVQSYHYGGQAYNHVASDFLSAATSEMVKGLLWMCLPYADKTMLLSIAVLAERAYRKIPGKGPAAASIGNACLYVLAHTKGLDGIGHLSRLKLRIKQSSTQSQIEKYLNKAAAAQGVSIHQIEDMAVDDFGLENGKRAFDFDGYKAVVKIAGVGKTALNWFKPDGTPQKSVPSFVQEKYSVALKELKETIKGIQVTVTAQRDRLDRMFKSSHTLSWDAFCTRYFEHGLQSFLTKGLIWTFEEEGKKESAIYIDDEWRHPSGKLSFEPSGNTVVCLWHPVLGGVEEIRSWRNFIVDQKIAQPMKQAFREVYLLTDAEINTRTYSNRMAAHLLKQHQFSSLAKLRGWKYALMGAYDNGRFDQIASILLPDHQLRAEFWINEVSSNDAFNETGIWLYVATDQVRFVNLHSGDRIEMTEVPPLVFSEVMRDTDLFVGVASVGNDPAWRDNGGMPAYRDYWQSYSFGDLTEMAKTRKTILERLVPRLKIARVAEIRDKFLVVKGKLRTYKIHIGSTNILMEPNDQYLCIVPDRGGKVNSENVYLNFEGDSGLSIILSKALLLSEDDKITDPTITRQIKRN